MPLLRKVLLKLTILALLLVILYCYQTSNGGGVISNNLRAQNAGLANLTTTLTSAKYSTEVNYTSSTTVASTMLQNGMSDYNVWCIFTKVTLNSPMKRKFQIFVDSLLKLTTIDIVFHVISDDDSRHIAQTVVQHAMVNTGKFMKVYGFVFFYIVTWTFCNRYSLFFVFHLCSGSLLWCT